MPRGKSIRSHFIIMLYMALACLLPVALRAESELEIMVELKQRAEVFVQALASGNAHTQKAEMNEQLRRSMTDETVNRIFAELYQTGGRLESIEPAELSIQSDGAVVAMVPIHLERRSVAAQVVFPRKDPLEKIAGFSLHPWKSKAGEGDKSGAGKGPGVAPPKYAAHDLFKERKLDVTSGDLVLPARLSVPIIASEQKKAPGVLLLSGAGAFDEDMSVGENRPMRDIAQGLASQGFVVLRFPQRSFVKPESLAPGTPYTLEVAMLADARAAFEALAAQPEVMVSSISIVGHDLGAFVAPKLAKELGASKLVLLAPVTPPITTHLIGQALRMKELIPEDTDPASLELDKVIAKVDLMSTKLLDPQEVLLGQSGSFWNDLYRLQPVADLQEFKKPFAIYFAGSDFMVEEGERDAWKEVLNTQPGTANTRVFDNLNHLFITSQVKGMDDIFSVGNVHESVVDSIATFLETGRVQ